ncbi:NAD-P-binding protein [Polyporus arcularius HHB13444]|uniref:NAD-P-binding protein n=1 Tax=Polyporus arcularius HHB13444 TaxID=1314778 RepID=A0A5C3P0R2_9APHY|nr:NAD-P-binding protein [Polyporus arcularius HHB13444]
MQLVWFITGASSGLGFALTERILARGDRVVATARNPRALDALLSHPDTDKSRIHVLKLDITSPFAILQETAQKAVEKWGRVDVLVNNAGIGGEVGASEELGVDWLMHVMKTNYAGTVNVTNALLPHMRSQRAGTVVLLGSRSAYRNEFLGPVAYAASKAAVHSYGETLSAEVAPFNICVTVVVPGTFDTPLAHPIIGTPIADYDSARAVLRQRVEAAKKMPNKGDPVKGMDALMDAVRGEGRAAGKAGLPLWLFLGSDCIADVKGRADRLTGVAEEWAAVGSGLGTEDPPAA